MKYCLYPVLLVSVLLLGCSSPSATTETPTEQSEKPSAIAQQVQGQQLPITAKATMGGETIELEVATTPEQQALGLMYREAETLPDNRGMLFPFDPPREVGFWMKNVKISLDMLFVYQGEIKDIAANVPPCDLEPCPTYGPNTEIDQVIELRGGRAEELGLKVGDRISVEFLSNSENKN